MEKHISLGHTIYLDVILKQMLKFILTTRKVRLKIKVFGDPEYVEHVLRYYHFGNNNNTDTQ